MKQHTTAQHLVLKTPYHPPFPAEMDLALFALGCFWGAERFFWQQPGVYTTAVGYSNGDTDNPDYRQVCSGLSNHNEVVRVVFNPKLITYQQLLESFWQSHNPTQGMRQGNDIGSQYRSGVYTYSSLQQQTAEASKHHYQAQLTQAGFAEITTEILSATRFYYAEEYHQQYLAKNPGGYCGLGGLGICYSKPE